MAARSTEYETSVPRVGGLLRSVIPQLIAISLLASGTVPASVQSMRTEDGLALRFGGDGRVVAVSVRDLPVPPLKTAGGFFVLDVARIRPTQAQWVEDPGFDRKGEGWRLGRQWSLDTTLGHASAPCAKLVVPPPNRLISDNLWTIPAVHPNTVYEIELWMRTEKCEGVAPHVWLGQLAADGKTNVAPQITLSHSNFDSGGNWFKIAGSFTTSPLTEGLMIRTGLYGGCGTVWVDDVRLTTSAIDYDALATPVRGQMSNDGRFHADLTKQKLKLDAEYQPVGDRLHVEGTLADISGNDRAIMLFYRLPVDASDGTWRWGQDLRHELPIVPGDRRYQNVRPLEAHQSMSLYPFASVTSAKVGLSLSVPMDIPRVFRIGYDNHFGYWLVWDLGISKVTESFPQRATFAFDVYRYEPKWGFRAADRRYIDLFPQYFVKSFKDDGSWTGYEGYATPPEQHLSVGEAKEFDWIRWVDRPLDLNAKWEAYDYWGDNLTTDDNACGIIPYAYTEPSGYWDWRIGHKPDPARKKLSLEDRISDLKDRAAKGNENAKYILRTAVLNREGKMVTFWGYDMWHWECNPSPFLPDENGQPKNIATQDWEAECLVRFKHYGCHCVYVDSGITSTRNYRREHFAKVAHPLTFDYDTRQLCIAEGFSAYEYLEWLRRQCDAEKKWMLVHWWGNEAATRFFGVHFGDTVGYEMIGSAPQEEQYLVARPLVYQKVVHMYSEFNRDTPREIQEKYAKSDIFYGHFTDLLDKVLARNYTAMERELSMAGWQPITGVSTDNASVDVERFGSLAQGNLHFSVRNRADTEQAANLILDGKNLEGGEPSGSNLFFQLLHTALEDPAPRPVQPEGRIPLQLASQDVAMVRVGTHRQLAAMRLQEVTRQLEGAKRFLALMAKDPKATSVTGLLEVVDAALASSEAGKLVELSRQVGAAWDGVAPLTATDRLAQQIAFALAEAQRVLSEALEVQFDLRLPPDSSLVNQPLNRLRDAVNVMRSGKFSVRAPEGSRVFPVTRDGFTVEDAAEQVIVTVAPTARVGLHPLAWEWTKTVGGNEARLWRAVDFKVVESPVAVQFRPLRFVRRDQTQQATVMLSGVTDQPLSGQVALSLPDSWKCAPRVRDFQLSARGLARLTFAVRVPAGGDETANVKVTVTANGPVLAEQTDQVALVSGRPLLVVHKATAGPKLDGLLDDDCWKPCQPITNLRTTDDKPAGQQSVVRVCYDDLAVYVAYECAESEMSKIVGAVTGVGGAVWNDDCVEVYFKPGHRTVVHLAANTIGGRFMRGANDPWKAAVKRGDTGWTIELAVPFAVLSEPTPLRGDLWGANFCREEKPHAENTCWSLPGFNDERGLGDLVFD